MVCIDSSDAAMINDLLQGPFYATIMVVGSMHLQSTAAYRQQVVGRHHHHHHTLLLLLAAAYRCSGCSTNRVV